MIRERLMKVLLAPVVSEKTTRVGDDRQVVFKVASDATKPEVKQAVEALFEVQVSDVRVANVKGKQKRFRQGMGRRSDWKKAYVTLKEGFDIDFAGAE